MAEAHKQFPFLLLRVNDGDWEVDDIRLYVSAWCPYNNDEEEEEEEDDDDDDESDPQTIAAPLLPWQWQW